MNHLCTKAIPVQKAKCLESNIVLTIFLAMIADSISRPLMLGLNTGPFCMLRAASGAIYLCVLGRPQILRINFCGQTKET